MAAGPLSNLGRDENLDEVIEAALGAPRRATATVDLSEADFVSTEQVAQMEEALEAESRRLRYSDLFGAPAPAPLPAPPAAVVAAPSSAPPPRAAWPEPPSAPAVAVASSGPWAASSAPWQPSASAAITTPPPALERAPRKARKSGSAGAWALCAMCVLAAASTVAWKYLDVGPRDVVQAIDPTGGAAPSALARSAGAAPVRTAESVLVAWQPSSSNAAWGEATAASAKITPPSVSTSKRASAPIAHRVVAAHAHATTATATTAPPAAAPAAAPPKHAARPSAGPSAEDRDAAAAARDQLRDSL